MTLRFDPVIQLTEELAALIEAATTQDGALTSDQQRQITEKYAELVRACPETVKGVQLKLRHAAHRVASLPTLAARKMAAQIDRLHRNYSLDKPGRRAHTDLRRIIRDLEQIAEVRDGKLGRVPALFATTGEDALIELEILGDMFEDIYKGRGLLGGPVTMSDPEYWRR